MAKGKARRFRRIVGFIGFCLAIEGLLFLFSCKTIEAPSSTTGRMDTEKGPSGILLVRSEDLWSIGWRLTTARRTWLKGSWGIRTNPGSLRKPTTGQPSGKGELSLSLLRKKIREAFTRADINWCLYCVTIVFHKNVRLPCAHRPGSSNSR